MTQQRNCSVNNSYIVRITRKNGRLLTKKHFHSHYGAKVYARAQKLKYDETFNVEVLKYDKKI